VRGLRAAIGAGVLTMAVLALSAQPAVAKSHKSPSPKEVVVAMKGRTLGVGWSAFVPQLPFKPAVAAETATDGALGVAYFAFPTTKAAHAFVKKPSTIAVVQARNAVPGSYVYAAQEGFNSSKLNAESTVYTFNGGVGIFLQQGTTVVLGTYIGTASTNGGPLDLTGIGLSKATQEGAQFLSTKPGEVKKPPAGFAGIDGKSMPGLPSSNWPSLQSTVGPYPSTEAASVSSNDDDYTVTFYDFSTPANATAFYNAPPGAMESFLGGALGYAPLSGSTGVSGQARAVDLRSCTGEGSGPTLLASGSCSNGSASYSVGVGTVVQVDSVVMLVGYLTTNNAPHANPADLAKNTKIALSGVKLLNSLGIE
jgi:hypothetical protein